MPEDLAALNKEAIAAAKRYMGRPAWLTVALSFAVVAGYTLNLGYFAAGVLPGWVALPVLAALTYFAYTPLHEAVHGNINGGRENLKWLNDLCGYLMAPMIAVPYSSHRVEHFTHHRYTNQPDKDPDYLMLEMSKGFVPALKTVLKFFWVQNTFFVKQQWGTASLRERSIYCLEVLVSLGWRVAFIALVAQSGTVAVILLGYLLGGFFTAYWFAYRPHLPYEDARRYRNTNSLIMPIWMKPLEWFWLGQNLHSIHHLFPRVPFYRYHALHRDIEPILRAQGTPIVGIFSREPVNT
jgi:beta-carotene hydroxylase